MAGLARLRQEGLEFKIISPCYINSFPPNKDINKHLKILKLIFFFWKFDTVLRRGTNLKASAEPPSSRLSYIPSSCENGGGV